MMNILSQLITENRAQKLASQKTAPASADGEAQGKSQRFASLMMGFIGMKAQQMNAQNTEGSSHLGQKIPTELQQSGESKKADGENIGEQASLTLFVGQLPSLAGKKISNGEAASGKNTVNRKLQGMQTAAALEGAASGKDAVSGADNVAENRLPDTSQKQGASQLPASQTAANTMAAKEQASTKDMKSSTKDSKRTPSKAAGSLPDSSAKGEVSKDNQSALNLSADKKQKPSMNSAVKFSSKDVTADLAEKVAPSIKETSHAAEGSLKKGNMNVQKKVSGDTISDAQKAARQATKAPASKQQEPSLKHLMQQVKDHKNNTQQKAADTKLHSVGNTKVDEQHASTSTGRSAVANTNFAQNLAAATPDKALFKPLQATSVKFELDPSKLAEIENNNPNKLDMEVQAQTDKDASGGDDGKPPLKFNGVTLSQMSKSGGRREFSTQLIRHIQQQSETGKFGSTQKWNHHRLMMDDGQALNVSVRQAEGALQLQLSAGNSELNKIIQQHIDEIRQHLREQMNVEIDLQLQHFGDQQADSKSNQSSAGDATGGGLATPGRETAAEESSSKRTARYLGFNNNEWTA